MSGDILILGELVLDANSNPFGMPSKVSGGTGQFQGVSQLIGGDRVIDAMGADVQPIKWSGKWRGPSASSLNDQMIAMSEAGQQIPCSWGENFYQVVIKTYTFEYEASFEIGYDLELTVLPDNSSSGSSALGDIIGGDLSSALGSSVFSTASNLLSGVTNQVAGLSSIIGAAGDLGGLSLSSLGPIIGQAQNAVGAIGLAIPSLDSSILSSAASGMAGVIAGGAPLAMASTLTGQLSTMNDMVALLDTQGSAGRILFNLQQATG